MERQRTTFGWGTVIIALIIFYPVGIFLLLYKLMTDRSAQFGGGAGLVKFIGYGFVILSAFILFGAALGDDIGSGFIAALVFFLPGLWLVRKGKGMRTEGELKKLYIEYIINNKIREVYELARRMGVSQDKVIKDVNDMISRGMLGKARLNLQTGIIQFPRPPRQEQPRHAQPPRQEHKPSSPHRDVRGRATPQETRRVNVPPRMEQRPVQKSFEPKTIRCTACSANNYVESLPAVCEYCGTSLHE